MNTSEREKHISELYSQSTEALALHNGNLNRATTMMALVLSHRVYLLDALIFEHLQRVAAANDRPSADPASAPSA
jgi:hypothetical protein